MRARLLAAMLCGLAVPSPSAGKESQPIGSPAAADYKPVGTDEQGLWLQFEELERQIKTSKLLVKDTNANAYVRHILCRIVGDENCARVRLYIVRNPIPNASMAPNGFMVIHTGMLLRVQDEAELAAVIGHEFGHFERRHSLARLKSLRNTASWVNWITVLAIGAGSSVNVGPTLWASHFSYQRDHEREADLDGLALIGRAGYRTACASEVWAHMREEEDARAAALGVRTTKDAYRGPFSTHPMDVERMTYLKAAADKVGADNSYVGTSELRVALSNIWPMLIEDQIKLNDFGTSEFLLKNLAHDNWSGQLLYARGELYRFRGKAGDFEQAAAFYREATAKADAPAGAWRGLGLALARTGDAVGAKTAIDEYLKHNPDASDKAMLSMIGGSR
ncbi:M48 family metalloprotease [Sphingomonas tabacisoli]|uniref:M48 family metalloprotease n=1 Tax=Sphingomonas tabacisoli TaxID=2249466 RepID=A0ABW4HZ78_9SPHN